MRLSLIVAMDKNRVIGRAGGLPWRLSSDLKRFKQLTMGHHLIMGRATFESIGRVLPGRSTIVVSRQSNYASAGVQVVGSIEEAIDRSRSDSETFVVGGGQIYRAVLPRVDRMYMTLVDTAVDGDTWFPSFVESDWQLIVDEGYPADAKNEFPYRFRILDRCRVASM